MHFSTITLIASLALSVTAQMPQQCKAICKPIVRLMAGCAADKMPVSKDSEKCVCMNKSFDVNKLGGLCMACIMMNGKESDVMMQVGMACPFQAIEYTPAADAMAEGITVNIPKESMPSDMPMPGMPMPSMSGMPGMPMPSSTMTMMPGMPMPSGGMPGMPMNDGSRVSSRSGLAVGFGAVLLAWGLA